MSPMHQKSDLERTGAWRPTATLGREYVADPDVEPEAQGPSVPPNESLKRRYEHSDKSWIKQWLDDEDDPCEPS